MNAVRFYTAVMICGLSVLLSGCHRSRYHRLDQLPGGTLQVEFDWNGYTEIPPGMNLVFYPLTDDATEEEAEGDAQPIVHQLQYDGGKVSVPYGRYNVAVYNDYTYNILYRGMGDFHTAEAYVDDNIRQPLATRLPDLRHVAEPDLFYVTQYNGLTVSPSDGDRVITLRPELVTLMLHVHVRGTGLENVKMADGALSGIAGSVMLSTGYSSDEAASDILFPFEVHPDELYASFRVFLLRDRLESSYTLNLAFLLRNNTVTMDKQSYDVGEQIAGPLRDSGGRIPPEGIHVYVDGLAIEDVVSSGGGFDAVIDNWGDSQDIELK